VNRKHIGRTLAFVSIVLGTASCSTVSSFSNSLSSAFSSKKSSGLSQVDELTSQIEMVQVEAAVSKERAGEALGSLELLTRTGYDGDAAGAHASLVKSIEASEEQADALRGTAEPLKETAASVFEQWTLDLEAIGNTHLRQRSQARLEETRARYEAILTAMVSAQISFDGFNADLRDHALFLGHDLNRSALAAIGQDVELLSESRLELERRLDACAKTARDYVASTSLHAEEGAAAAEPDAQKVSATRPVPAKPANQAAKATATKTGAVQATQQTPAKGTSPASATAANSAATSEPAPAQDGEGQSQASAAGSASGDSEPR
jgi:hypothetical protein